MKRTKRVADLALAEEDVAFLRRNITVHVTINANEGRLISAAQSAEDSIRFCLLERADRIESRR